VPKVIEQEGLMAEIVSVKNTGLRGITVADTKISFIDGEKGVLIYRGYRIEDLAKNSTFPEVALLLLNGVLPEKKELELFEKQIADAGRVPEYVFKSMKHWPGGARPMDVLQAAVPILAVGDGDIGDQTREANVRMAVRLIARVPAVVAGWHRIRQGLDPLAPDDSLSHAANFLLQLHGQKPDAETARDLDVCLVLHADHTFNASTFACREVVSTRAHMYAGIAAGIGALSGSLHGGANAEVMKMLLELEPEKDVPGWVKARLERGDRIMGMGHAVYKTMDPRARFLKDMAYRIGKKTGQSRWHELSTQIEKAGLEEFKKRGKTEIQPPTWISSALPCTT
jgi:citrate synthase